MYVFYHIIIWDIPLFLSILGKFISWQWKCWISFNKITILREKLIEPNNVGRWRIDMVMTHWLGDDTLTWRWHMDLMMTHWLGDDTLSWRWHTDLVMTHWLGDGQVSWRWPSPLTWRWSPIALWPINCDKLIVNIR